MYKTAKNVSTQNIAPIPMLTGKLLIFMLVLMSVFLIQTKRVSAEDTYTAPTVYDNVIYANGFPILIMNGTQENTSTIYCNLDGDKVYETTLASNLPYSKTQGDARTNYTIYGGAYNGSVENTSILVKGGYIDRIEAGGEAKGTNAKAEVTGKAEITMEGGKVNWFNCTGRAWYGGTVKVNNCVFTMTGGMANGLGINGHVDGTDNPKSYLNDASIYINGGTLLKINDFYSWGSGSILETTRVSTLQINGASVEECNIGNKRNLKGITYNNLPTVYPSRKDGKQVYPKELYVQYDGTDYVEKQIDSVITNTGETVTLKNVYTYPYTIPFRNVYTGETSTAVRGRFFVWLPENTEVEGGKIGQDSLLIDKTYDSKVLSNLIPIPRAMADDQAPRYNESPRTGIENMSTYTKNCPYTMSGDDRLQIYPGTYTTTFTLKAGYKWEDMTTGPKTVVWKIRKATQEPPRYLRVAHETKMNKNNGTIFGLREIMEISTDQKKWTSLKGRLDDGALRYQAPGDYYVRYAELDYYEASESVKVTINPAPVYTLSLVDYKSEALLEKISADIISGASKIYIPETYFDYACFHSKTGGASDQYSFLQDEGGYYTSIESDLTIYALAPSYRDIAAKFDLSNDKALSVSLWQEGTITPEQMVASYFLGSLWEKATTAKEFGDLSERTPDEIRQFLCTKTYYITPCPADSIDVLTQGDRIVAETMYKDAKVIPHISLMPEKDSIMSLQMEAVKDENSTWNVTLYFKGVKKEGVSQVLTLDLGQTPYEANANIIQQSPLENIVYKTTTLNVKYGQGKDTENEDPGSGENPGDPGSKDGPLSGGKTVSGNEPILLSQQDKILTSANTDKGDPKGSTFRFLKPRVTKVKKHEITIGWKPLKEADGYVIYGAKCGSKMKKLKTIQKPMAHSCRFKKLKADTYYKFIVVAYKNAKNTEQDQDGSQIVLSTSTSLHAATAGGRKKNPLGISLKKSRISVKKGKSTRIRAAMRKKGKVQYHIAKFRYESLDPDIATVSKSGKVKGLKKGKTKIFIYTQNGIYKTVSVTVK
ncbi:MAG: fibronectin type III domain-containing protein [Lachnospiraceae bacterium]|nr:fibronectin type III domain-containing protein [Lachnospiraceae bacterium]